MMDPERTFREFLAKIAKDQNYEDHVIKIKPLSSEGANYSSQLFLANLSSKNKEDLNVFAKVAMIGEKIRAVVPVTIFDCEGFFYTKILKRYKEFEDDNNLAEEMRLLTPKFYGSSVDYLNEVLVLEDLAHRGFTMFDRFSVMTWEYATQAFKELAKFHALSMTYHIRYPEEFEAIAADKFKNPVYLNIPDYVQKHVALALQVLKEEFRDRFKKFADENLSDLNEFEMYFKPVRRPVLAHGDYRQSNLMHLEKLNGQYQIVILDYQTIQLSNCVTDVLYFIFNGTDEQFRAKYYQKLLDHYYTELSQALRRLGLDPDTVYSRDDFEYELKKVLPFGLCIILLTLPLVTVDTENTPAITEDSDIMDFIIKPSELYKERLNGIVSDYAKMGLL